MSRVAGPQRNAMEAPTCPAHQPTTSEVLNEKGANRLDSICGACRVDVARHCCGTVHDAVAGTGAALAQGRLQVARKLISDLASETVVSISKLPLGTYPAALKQAAALLHQGKPKEAKTVLQAALNTIVVEDIIIPLPLVRAQAALEEARSLLEKKKRSEAESARMRGLLGTARGQLLLGKALGYATDREMPAA